jgi:molybdopterin adenylyltransferase
MKNHRIGHIKAICVSPQKGMKKTVRPEADFMEGYGIRGDAHAGSTHRQVSALDLQAIESVRQKGVSNLQPGDFGENLILQGIGLNELGLGSRLRLGPEAVITVTQRGKICHSPCSIYHQTGDCIMPREGVFARVLQGGRVASGDQAEVLEKVSRDVYQVVILTLSDRASAGEAEDTAGPATAELIRRSKQYRIYTRKIIPDDRMRLADTLRHYGHGHSIDLVITIGGTGFSPRDITPEAVASVIDRPAPGLDETMRRISSQKTPHAMLSGGVSGICGSTLILSLPGSRTAAVENLLAVLPALEHGLAKLRGSADDCAPERR